MSVLIFLIPPWDLLVLETERYDINSSKGKFYSFVYSFNKPAVGNYSITVPGMMKGAEFGGDKNSLCFQKACDLLQETGGERADLRPRGTGSNQGENWVSGSIFESFRVIPRDRMKRSPALLPPVPS